MSAQSIQRIYDRFVAQTEQACAEGRGKDLYDRFMKEMAADYAATVFLMMQTILVADGSNHPEAELHEWAQGFRFDRGMDFVESLTETLAAFNASPKQIDEGATAAAEAYRDSIDALFAQVGQGSGGRQ